MPEVTITSPYVHIQSRPQHIYHGQPYARVDFIPLSGTSNLASENRSLKVPKREIFDRSDFPDFYTIKSLRVGDFGVKKKKKFQNF
jgi:hypothetical protein